jgi:hypothetical protein
MANQGSGFWGAFAQGLPYIQIPGYEKEQQNLQRMLAFQQQQAQQRELLKMKQAEFQAQQAAIQQQGLAYDLLHDATTRPLQEPQAAVPPMEWEGPSEYHGGRPAQPGYTEVDRRAQLAQAGKLFGQAGNHQAAQQILGPLAEPHLMSDHDRTMQGFERRGKQAEVFDAEIKNRQSVYNLVNTEGFMQQRNEIAAMLEQQAQTEKSDGKRLNLLVQAKTIRSSNDPGQLATATKNFLDGQKIKGSTLEILVNESGLSPIDALKVDEEIKYQYRLKLDEAQARREGAKPPALIAVAAKELFPGQRWEDLAPSQTRAAVELAKSYDMEFKKTTAGELPLEGPLRTEVMEGRKNLLLMQEVIETYRPEFVGPYNATDQKLKEAFGKQHPGFSRFAAAAERLNSYYLRPETGAAIHGQELDMSRKIIPQLLNQPNTFHERMALIYDLEAQELDRKIQAGTMSANDLRKEIQTEYTQGTEKIKAMTPAPKAQGSTLTPERRKRGQSALQRLGITPEDEETLENMVPGL